MFTEWEYGFYLYFLIKVFYKNVLEDIVLLLNYLNYNSFEFLKKCF